MLARLKNRFSFIKRRPLLVAIICLAIFSLLGGIILILHFTGVICPTETEPFASTTSRLQITFYTQTGKQPYSAGNADWAKSAVGGSADVEFYMIDPQGYYGGTGVRHLKVNDDTSSGIYNGVNFPITWDTINSGSNHYNGYNIHVTANSGYGVASIDGRLICLSYGDISSSSTEFKTVIAFCKTYKLSVNLNGGTGGTTSATAYLGYVSPNPLPVPTLTGFTFAGYADARDWLRPILYTDSDGNWEVRFTDPTLTELTAVWNPIEDYFTVNFDKQNGTGGSDSVKATGGAVMKSITPPTRAGYTFQGYYTAQNGGGTKYYNSDGTPYNGKTYPNINPPTTLYAYWTIGNYTIIFDKQGGEGGTSSANVTYNAALPTITLPTRTGYTFNGYWTQRNGKGTQYYSASGSKLKSTYTNTYGITLYASWKWNIVTPWSGSGTASSPYKIATPYHLYVLANNTNAGADYSDKYFEQTANLSLSSYSNWTPIGTYTFPFKGNYDGGNFKITNLKIDENVTTSGGIYYGLFGYISSSSATTFKNIDVSGTINLTYTGQDSAIVGGIAGYVNGTSGNQIMFEHCTNRINITSQKSLQSNIGGIVGSGSYFDIHSCINYGDIVGNEIGGIAEHISGDVLYCRNYGNLEAYPATYSSSTYTGTAGGIASTDGYQCNVSYCINYGNVTASDMASGIIVYLYDKMSNCITKGTITGKIASCFAAQVASGPPGSHTITNCAGYGEINVTDSNPQTGVFGNAWYSCNFLGCSFIGTSNKDLPMVWSDKEYTWQGNPILINSYAKIGSKKIFTDRNTGWSQRFRVVPNLNEGLPMQTAIFAVAVPAQTDAYIYSYLKDTMKFVSGS